jgi:hypothetical protein
LTGAWRVSAMKRPTALRQLEADAAGAARDERRACDDLRADVAS